MLHLIQRYKNKISPLTAGRFAPFILLVAIGSQFTMCAKYVDIDPPATSTTYANVYNKASTAAAVLTGLYASISQPGIRSGNLTSISLLSGLSADELTLFDNTNTQLQRYYLNNLSGQTDAIGGELWNSTYPLIFTANSAIEGLTASALQPEVKSQLIGEAKFMRAFLYFYLVNLYGEVPLVTTTNYQQNAVMPRTSKQVVLQQIISDLQEATTLLKNDYVEADALTSNASTARVRPNAATASALLARTYLYTKDYTGAITNTTSLISDKRYALEPLSEVFKSSSQEAIWQLQPVNAGWNTEDARSFVLPATGPSSFFPVYLSELLVTKFEDNDQRKSEWTGKVSVGNKDYYYPAKYKNIDQGAPVTEFNTVLRLSEQFLIRAEARAETGDLDGAKADLLALRQRAGLTAITATTKEDILTAIVRERSVELFTEWGHRWLDLKRTGTIDAVMNAVTVVKGGSWKTTSQLYPVPLQQLLRNPNLVQNEGYK